MGVRVNCVARKTVIKDTLWTITIELKLKVHDISNRKMKVVT